MYAKTAAQPTRKPNKQCPKFVTMLKYNRRLVVQLQRNNENRNNANVIIDTVSRIVILCLRQRLQLLQIFYCLRH